MAITTQDSRIIIKRSSITGQVPTIAPSNDHTDGSWNPLNIYKSEIFINLADSKIWMRDDSGIQRIALYSDILATNELSEVLANGNTTGGTDIIISNTDLIKSADSNVQMDFGSGVYFEVSRSNSYVYIDNTESGLGTNLSYLAIKNSDVFLTNPTKITIEAPEVTFGFANNITANLKLYNNTNLNFVAIKSGITTTSYDITLPVAAPAVNGYVLSATTAGVTSWVAQSGGGGGLLNGTTSGTDTYTATIAGVAAYADGDAYLIRFPNGNTTNCTLNINGLGAINLYKNNDGPLIGGDIQPNGEMLCVYDSGFSVFRCIGSSPNSIITYVTNDDSVTITKGMPVYAFSGTGDRMTVKRAYNTLDATSAQTMGLVLSTSIAAGQKGFIITQGLLDGLSTLPTATFADGDAVYLGPTAGTITNIKPHAPNHLVYLGVVTTASAGSSGRMYVKVQNGYELDEIHNVQAQTPALKDTLYYDSADSQWKTAQIATILGYNPSITNLFSYYNFI